MPYSWIDTHPQQPKELHLWPHQSLPPKGYAAFILATFALITLPLFPVLGTIVLWGLLPFLLLTVGGIWLALNKSWRDRQILEILTLSEDQAHLIRSNPGGDIEEWDCNRYWATPEIHERGGPVPNYVTLRGCGREVEIGAFLSEPERKALYDDLLRAFRART